MGLNWRDIDRPERARIQACEDSIAESRQAMRDCFPEAARRGRESRAKRAAARKPRGREDLIRGALVLGCVLCVLGAGLAFAWGGSDLEDYRRVMAEQEAIRARLQDQLATAQARDEADTEQVLLDVMGAQRAGEAIAEIQDAYLSSPPYTRVMDGSMAYDEWEEAYDDLYKACTEVIEDGTGWQGAWYIPPEIYLDQDGKVPFHWKFEKAYNYTDEYVPAVWTCWRDGTDELAAYAVGKYYFDKGKVLDLDVRTTSYGQRILDAAGDLVLTYDFNDGKITERERENLIEALEADAALREPDIDDKIAAIRSVVRANNDDGMGDDAEEGGGGDGTDG